MHGTGKSIGPRRQWRCWDEHGIIFHSYHARHLPGGCGHGRHSPDARYPILDWPMKEQTIFKMQEANARRSLLILQQFEFLQTKIQAYEEILSTCRTRIGFVLWPDLYKRIIDNRQTELLDERKRAFEKASKAIVPAGRHG